MDWQSEVRDLLRQGAKAQALQRVTAHLRAHPRDVAALLWFAGLTEDREKAIAALRYVLRLDPQNAAARKGLAALEAAEADSRAENRRVRVAKERAKASAPDHGPEKRPTLSSSAPRPSSAPSIIRGGDVLRRARATLWPFKGLNRPLGTLLEVGMVEPQDLAWAVKNARDPEIRWAAAVLLHEEEIQDLRLTPAQAQEPKFPFRQLQRPLGELLREGHIGLADLAYAVDKAYSPRLRLAAAALGYLLLLERDAQVAQAIPSAVEVSQEQSGSTATETTKEIAPQTGPTKMPATSPLPSPAPSVEAPTGPLRVFQASDYLLQQREKHERQVTLAFYGLRTLILLIAVVSIGGGLYLSLHLHQRTLGTVVTWLGVLGLAGVARVLPWYEQLRAQREAYRLGMAGEQRLVDLLRGKLDARWALYRNLNLPDGQGDLDAVLVGPRGVYVLEVKAYRGAHRYRGNEWYRRRWGKWTEIDANPSQQALRNALRLADFLRQHGAQIWVEPRVVWAGPGRVWIDGRPEVPLWDLSRPGWIWRDLGRGKALTPEVRRRVHQALQTLLPEEARRADR